MIKFLLKLSILLFSIQLTAQTSNGTVSVMGKWVPIKTEFYHNNKLTDFKGFTINKKCVPYVDFQEGGILTSQEFDSDCKEKKLEYSTYKYIGKGLYRISQNGESFDFIPKIDDDEMQMVITSKNENGEDLKVVSHFKRYDEFKNTEVEEEKRRKEDLDSPISNYIYIRNVKYKTTKINETVWMAENLTVSHFANGEPIPYARTKEEWTKAAIEKKPAYCYLNNTEANKHLGKFYNGYVILDSRGIAPKNWRIPTRNDWVKLAEYMRKTYGNDNYQDKLKSTKGWSKFMNTNNGTNETGFSAIPTGDSDSNEELYGSKVASFAQWWSTDKVLGNKHFKNRLFSPGLEFVRDGLITNLAKHCSKGITIRLIKE